MDLQSYIELKKKYTSMNVPQPVSEEVEVVEEENIEEGLIDTFTRGAGQIKRAGQKMFGDASQRNDAVSYEKSLNDINARKAKSGDTSKTTQNDISAETAGRRRADPNYKPGQGVDSGQKLTANKPDTNNKPTGGTGGGVKPAPKTGANDPRNAAYMKQRASIQTAKTPQAKATATKKAETTGMDTWAKANPKLAAAQKQRAATRGTTASSNPMMKGLGRTPTPKPTPTVKPTTPTVKPTTATKPTTPSSKSTLKMSNDLDSFDVILEYLVGSGFPEQEALVIMAEMSEEKREQILSEMDYQSPPKPVPTAPIERKAKQPETRKAPGVDKVTAADSSLDPKQSSKDTPKHVRTVLKGAARATEKMKKGKKSTDSGPGVTLPALAGVTAAKSVEAALEMAKKKKDKKKGGPPPVMSAVKTTKEEIDSLRDAYNSVFTEKAELSIKDQMRISREAAKNRNPNPDHRAIRAKQMKNSTAPKDTRTDAEKMTDATGPRKGSNYRGD